MDLKMYTFNEFLHQLCLSVEKKILVYYFFGDEGTRQEVKKREVKV